MSKKKELPKKELQTTIGYSIIEHMEELKILKNKLQRSINDLDDQQVAVQEAIENLDNAQSMTARSHRE